MHIRICIEENVLDRYFLCVMSVLLRMHKWFIEHMIVLRVSAERIRIAQGIIGRTKRLVLYQIVMVPT